MSLPPPEGCENLNDGQRSALDCGRDLLVDAGAGAGKTQVLALRVLALLEEGYATIPEIVAFTFTDKAASEMRARVQELLFRRIAHLELVDRREPGDGSVAARLKRLHRARAEFSFNRITTVHGFCHRLLSDHAWEANLEPGAPMLDDRAQRLARRAAVTRVVTRTSPEDDLAAAQALERLGATTRLKALSDTLQLMLTRRHEIVAELERATAAWADPAAAVESRRIELERMLQTALEPTRVLLGQLPFAALSVVATDDKLRQKLAEIARALSAWPAAESRDTLCEALLTRVLEPRSFAGAGAAKKWTNAPTSLEQARALLAQAAQDMAQSAGDILRFRFDEAHERRSGAALMDMQTVFTRVLAAYAEECAGSLDYLDLELRAQNLLSQNQQLARAICGKIAFLLIDEFQDTNPTQSALFEQLIKHHHTPGRLFVVGDAKQSVYGFRGADVGVFNDARSSIPARNLAAGLSDKPQILPFGLACDDTPHRRLGLVALNVNYRSTEPLLSVGNRLFESVLGRKTYRRFDAQPGAMISGRRPEDFEPKQPVEMHLLPARSQRQEADDNDADSADEPEFVAQLVQRLVSQGVKLGDIAILVRRRARNAAFAQAFARHRLPLVAMGEGGLLQQQEVLDCLNLLRALVNPADDIAMLGLLRSPLGGLSDCALMQMAAKELEKAPPLCQRLENLSPERADDVEALSRFRSMFMELRGRVGRDAPAEILARALAASGAALAVSCESRARQRVANLDRLVDVVREMQLQFPSLAALSRELARRAEDEDDEVQGEPEQAGDFVRVMTIHGAKGLEFPVVIVPETGNARSANDTLLVRDIAPRDEAARPLGLYLPWLGDDGDRGKLAPDFEAWRAAREAKERGRSEYRRLCYVAFTRARERLILTGAVKSEIRVGEKASWAEILLGSMGCGGFGMAAPGLPAGMRLEWVKQVETGEARSLKKDVESVERALATGFIEIPKPMDSSLVAPLPRAAHDFMNAGDPQSAEFGVLLHAEMERRVLARQRGSKPSAAHVSSNVAKHVQRAEEALATLTKARELPEWRLYGEAGERRIDLLRVQAGDVFEIIDFKTDDVEVGQLRHRASEQYGKQLREYAGLLRDFLARRGQKPKQVRLLVCFTAPENAKPSERLIEIPENP